MLSENLKNLIKKLELKYDAVAIKFCLEKPECEHFSEKKNRLSVLM